MIRQLTDALKEKNIPYRTGVLTATLCSFRIGGVAALLIEPQCPGELVESVALCQRLNCPYYLVGRGSHLLFPDGAISTVLIRTAALQAIRETAHGLEAACGASLARLSYLAATQGMGGLTFAFGIPGTLGGGVYMNAGAHGGALSDVVRWVKYYDPEQDEIKTVFKNELSFSYRYSTFQSEKRVILSAELMLQRGHDPQALLQKMRKQSCARKTSQPLELPSAGSCFKRPSEGVPIAKMIDELGLKGLRIGGAAISQKHAGFVVNLGGATAADVKSLIKEIQKILQKERGITPQPELQFVPSGT
ncbi:MAG: UDP-N-acetylmuramate dehydrogenase [Clostridia bacterium]|nr:UDP-N-acetylmuramate dehydrogenase [Clostridia bacterium]